MSDNDLAQTAVMAWTRRNLPARIDVTQTAKLLGFAEHDIPILVAARKLTPLGNPAPNAPKWFAAIEIIHLSLDREWLHKATKELGNYWRRKRERSATGLSEHKRPFSAECSPKPVPGSSIDQFGSARSPDHNPPQ
jgi:hypothetical protein